MTPPHHFPAVAPGQETLQVRRGAVAPVAQRPGQSARQADSYGFDTGTLGLDTPHEQLCQRYLLDQEARDIRRQGRHLAVTAYLTPHGQQEFLVLFHCPESIIYNGYSMLFNRKSYRI
jgi:hypothetical protein